MFQNVLETIGDTPVLPVSLFKEAKMAKVFAKYEAANPSFSLKDRIAKAMIESAVASGEIKPEVGVVDATFGNTGVSLAMVCAVKKIPIQLFIPEDASLEKQKMLLALGAKVTPTPKAEGLKGAIQRAEAYVVQNPTVYWPRQFENPLVPQTHEETTAQEILNDFPQGIDALVCGVGTGGTLTGVGRVLKKKFPKLKVVAVEPEASAVLSGKSAGEHKISQIGYGFIPKNLEVGLIDETVQVSDREAYQMTRRIAREMGVLVGISSGANLLAAEQVAKQLGPDALVLTFFCDAGQRYFSLEKVFNNKE